MLSVLPLIKKYCFLIAFSSVYWQGSYKRLTEPELLCDKGLMLTGKPKKSPSPFQSLVLSKLKVITQTQGGERELVSSDCFFLATVPGIAHRQFPRGQGIHSPSHISVSFVKIHCSHYLCGVHCLASHRQPPTSQTQLSVSLSLSVSFLSSFNSLGLFPSMTIYFDF